MHLGFAQLTLLTAAWLNSYKKISPHKTHVLMRRYPYFI